MYILYGNSRSMCIVNVNARKLDNMNMQYSTGSDWLILDYDKNY